MGEINHSIDAATGVIRIVGNGVYTMRQATDHFASLTKTVSSVRSERGRVKVLIDASKGAVQPADVADKIACSTMDLYGPKDRIALVVASTLHKVQMRRITDPTITGLFVSETAALTWLCAYDR